MEWTGGLVPQFFLLPFIKAGHFPLLYIPVHHWPAQKRHRGDNRQPVLAAQVPREVFVKARAAVTASRLTGTNPHSWAESAGSTTVYYCHGVLPPAGWAFAAGNWKFTAKHKWFSPPYFCWTQTQWGGVGWQWVRTYLQNELLGWVGHQDPVAPGWTPRVHVLLSLARVLAVWVTANESQPQPSATFCLKPLAQRNTLIKK